MTSEISQESECETVFDFSQVDPIVAFPASSKSIGTVSFLKIADQSTNVSERETVIIGAR